MTGNRWQDLGPSAVLAIGIVAALSAQAAWSDLAGTAVLALAVLAADALASRLRGWPSHPSPAAWILAGTFVLAGALALLREPGHAGSLIPVFGLGAWTVFFMPGSRLRQAKEDVCSHF